MQIYDFYRQQPNKEQFLRKKVIRCAHICKLFVYLSPEGVFFIK